MTKPLQRIVGAVTLFSFVVTNSVWGMPQAGIEVLSSRETPGFFHIEIPDNLASIEEIYEAPAKPDPRLILHIQNAHGNYEAQSKIKDLLDYLYKTYGFKLIFVEGAAEPLNADYMRLFPDAERNMQLADYFAQKGELTGAELYLMNAPGDVKAIGIEKTELYRANYDAFKKVYGAKSDSDNFLAGTSAKLERLASRFYSPEARQLLSEWGKFEEGHREFLPYVKKLSLDAKKALGLDLESIFAQVEWPQITRLLVIQSMEKDLNRETALTERARLVEFLKSKRVSEEVLKSVETFEEKKITMNRASADPESYRNSPRYLLERLVEEAGPKGFYFHDYPAFSLYAGYLILKSELDSKNLFKEIEILFDKILTELTKTELEKNLLELFRDQKLLTKLMHLELNREEWQRAVYRREWIKPDAMNERIKHLESGKISVDMIQGPGEAELKPLAEIFATAFSFYELAHERESVFYQTLRDEMSNSKSEKAVLITGGFHTDGLMELFREDEVSFSTLMPRLTQKPETDNYIATMMETRKTIFDTANLEEVLRQITEGTRFGQGANRVSPHGEVQGMVLAILEIAQRTNTTEAEAREILANLGQTAYGQDRQASVEENSDHVSIVRHRGESVGGLRLIPGNPFAYSRADVKTGPVVLTQNSVKATLGMLGQKAEAQKGRLIPQAKTTAAASEMRTNLQSYNVDVRWLSGASAQTGYHVTVGDKTATGFTSEQLAASLERVIAEIFGEGKFSAQTPTPYELTFSVIDISSGKIFSADSRKESEVQSALQKAVDLLSVLTTIESTPRRLLVGGRGIQRPDGPFMKQLNQLPPISSDDEEDRAASEIRATSFKKWTLTALLIGAVGFTAASYGYIAYLAYPPKASNQELAKRSFNRQRAYQMGYTALTPVRWVTNLFGVPEDGLSQWFDRKARNQFIETRVFNAGAIEDWNRELNEDLNKLRQSEMRVSNLPSDSQLRKPKIFKTFVIAATFLASALGIGSGIAYYQTRLADPPNASAEELQNRSKNRLKFYGDIYSELKPVRTLVQEVANNPNIVDPVSFRYLKKLRRHWKSLEGIWRFKIV
ncbi:MAG: hypothetical protein HYZ84_02545 [Candidatus Omnitrophica bacterium]|nr:hypothetical protein [Candidatus Omnitrophota bacterium]